MTAIKISNSFAHTPADLHPFKVIKIMTLTLHSLLWLQKWSLPADWSTVKSAAFNYCVLMELVSPAAGAFNYSALVDLLSPISDRMT
jgi:hypothetical protein